MLICNLNILVTSPPVERSNWNLLNMKLARESFVCSATLTLAVVHLAPVVQRPDNFIQWISHYPTVPICAKMPVFPHVKAKMHTLNASKFGSVRKPWTTFNVKYILDPE